METSSNATVSLDVLSKEITVILKTYRLTVFSSGVLIAGLSVITFLGNGLLLVAIWKDPFRAFRIPSTVFVIGLTVADFLTGFIVGPLHAYIRIAYYLDSPIGQTARFKLIQQVCEALTFLTMNSSYHILLFLTWSQYTAVSLPHSHRTIVTSTRVCVCVCCVWVYAIVFSMLPLFGIDPVIIGKLDLYMNTTTSLVLLVIAYICLFSAFRRRVSKVSISAPSSSGNNPRASRRRRRRSERQFTAVTLVLVMFIILFTLPSAVVQYIGSYWRPNSRKDAIKFYIVSQYAGIILFLKFALDPFIYCWRLSSYRRALKSILTCGAIRVAADVSIDSSGPVTVRYRAGTVLRKSSTRDPAGNSPTELNPARDPEGSRDVQLG